MNEVIERVFRGGFVEDAQGHAPTTVASSVTREAGTLLYDLVRAFRPDRTLETGMAHGISTLCICQAHRENGTGSHTAIDPFQESIFKSSGLATLERAHLRDLLRFYQAASHDVLPQLCAQGERLDFAFIDGDHRFDYALVDLFYIDKLLNVGGHVAVDDLWLPSVRRVVSFAVKNMPYELVRPPSTTATPRWTRLLRTGRRIVQNPLGRDWALKFVPENVAVLRKTGADRRGWDHYGAF
jgi:predicted O-methyltransferase YrrM